MATHGKWTLRTREGSLQESVLLPESFISAEHHYFSGLSAAYQYSSFQLLIPTWSFI